MAYIDPYEGLTHDELFVTSKNTCKQGYHSLKDNVCMLCGKDYQTKHQVPALNQIENLSSSLPKGFKK